MLMLINLKEVITFKIQMQTHSMSEDAVGVAAG